MRGFFGICVLFGHLRFLLDGVDVESGPAIDLLPGHGNVFNLTGSLVALFFVISGFVLTIPIARRGTLGGGFWAFMRRRARRMVPAYYAAIVLSIPLYVLQLRLQGMPVARAGVVEQVVLHALFLHNLWYVTLEGLNGAMWSVATEWQAYILFAVFLVPLQRRFGILAGIVAAYAIGLVPTLLAFHGTTVPYGLRVAHFWYFGIFMLGSTAAFVAFAPGRFERLRNAFVWKTVSGASLLAYAALVAPLAGHLVHTTPLSDTAIGLALASYFLALAIDDRAGRRPLFVRFFSTRPLVWLGTFSYSLYLVHQPIVTDVMLLARPLPPIERIWVAAIAGPLVIAFGYGFARAFEFPFLSTFYRKGELNALVEPPRLPVGAAPESA